MKKRSLLALSLVSLVSLVGCGKDGGSAKISGSAFDDLVAAQFGLYYVGMETGDFEEDPYTLATVKFDLSVKYSASWSPTGEKVDNHEKGEFKCVYDAASYAWSVDPDAGYSEEDLEFYSYILESESLYCPLGAVSWVYPVYYGTKYSEYLLETFSEEGDSVSFNAAPGFTTGYKGSETEEEEVTPEEGEAYTVEVKYSWEGGQSMKYADRYGFVTYSETHYSEKASSSEKSLAGSMSYSYKYSISYSNPVEDEAEGI